MIKEERHNQQYLIQTSNLNSREKCLDKLILGYGVIGSTEDFDSSSLGSSPDTLALNGKTLSTPIVFNKAITWILISKLPPAIRL